ncbi:glycosyltransferase family 1 protein [Rhodococcus sp. AD45-ID]|nr:glycosyltransferase family 1 protein [Rhodococcus sp. AD45-ID]
MPGRILDRHVGGNTTYARTVAEGLRARDVEVVSMPFSNNAIRTIIDETRVGLQRNSAHVLHYVADTGPLVPTNTPSVVTVHGVASRWISGVRGPAQEKIWRTRVRRAIASTDALMTVSQSSAKDIAEIFDVSLDSIQVIPHGIEWGLFESPVALSNEVSERIPDDFMLYVGNIEPRKNIPALVNAVAAKDVRAHGLPLVIAGKPAWNFSEAMATIESSPDVIYLGFVSDDDRAALMQRCALFVFPSRYEGFGFPVLEAMAAGAPVLTSNCGALAEVAGPSKILDSVDADAISQGITETLADADWLSSATRDGKAWSSSFSWSASVDAHLALYRKVLGN